MTIHFVSQRLALSSWLLEVPKLMAFVVRFRPGLFNFGQAGEQIAEVGLGAWEAALRKIR